MRKFGPLATNGLQCHCLIGIDFLYISDTRIRKCWAAHVHWCSISCHICAHTYSQISSPPALPRSLTHWFSSCVNLNGGYCRMHVLKPREILIPHSNVWLSYAPASMYSRCQPCFKSVCIITEITPNNRELPKKEWNVVMKLSFAVCTCGKVYCYYVTHMVDF